MLFCCHNCICVLTFTTKMDQKKENCLPNHQVFPPRVFFPLIQIERAALCSAQLKDGGIGLRDSSPSLCSQADSLSPSLEQTGAVATCPDSVGKRKRVTATHCWLSNCVMNSFQGTAKLLWLHFNTFTSSAKSHVPIPSCLSLQWGAITTSHVCSVTTHGWGPGEIPVLGSGLCHSPLHHAAGLGGAAAALPAVVVLVPYGSCNRARKKRCWNSKHCILPATMWLGCWSKLQGSICVPSPEMWLERLRGTWGLGKSHCSSWEQAPPEELPLPWWGRQFPPWLFLPLPQSSDLRGQSMVTGSPK